ncbi:MAG TPA: thioredoxin domain-containing protein, partial [Blastocatellia bacterium]|nr:thioredoxin domain-containing protein [Blastocatellia bacterium]
SEGEEGKFFVWSPEEIVETLGDDEARIFCLYYDVTEEGNFEGHNIPNIKNATADTAKALGISEDELAASVERSREKLFAEREKRIKPFRDEKILTAWNGLMLAAFAEAAAVLANDEYLAAAKANADFLLGELVSEGRVLRTWKDGQAKLNGYIEDYANLADGLLELYQVSGETRYFTEARRLAEMMITEFWDAENGGFYFTSNDHEELIVRNKDFNDNATPSGNSVAADVLLKLAKFTGEEKYERFAMTVLRLMSGQIRRFPNGFGRALGTLEFALGETKEVAIVGDDAGELAAELWREYRPLKVVAVAGEAAANDVPLLEGRAPVDGKPAAYVCEGFVCKRPVTNAAELAELL